MWRLIMSGYTGKWESELEKNPYIFLIPDSPLKKNVVCDSYGTCKGICGRMYHLHSYWEFFGMFR